MPASTGEQVYKIIATPVVTVGYAFGYVALTLWLGWWAVLPIVAFSAIMQMLAVIIKLKLKEDSNG